MDITVTLNQEENTVTIEAEILGLALHSGTIIMDDVPDLYAAITGDQCAVTDIHIAAES